MTYLRENREDLRKTVPAFVEAVVSSSGGRLSMSSARDGSVTAKCDGQWVHSAYDPRKEARAWAEATRCEWN